MTFFQRKPWGARQMNLETEGSVRPDGLRDLLEAMLSVATGLIDPSLIEGQKEGSYNAKTMTWKGPNGEEHTQRCNARRLVENHSDTSDFC